MPTADDLLVAPGRTADELLATMPVRPTADDLLQAAAPQSVVGQVAAGVIRKFGLDPKEPGPVEGVLSAVGLPPTSPLGAAGVAAVDIPLRVLGSPFIGAGEAAKDILELGGAGVARAGRAVGLPIPEEATLPTETRFSQGVGIATGLAAPFAPRLLPKPPAVTVETTADRLKVRVGSAEEAVGKAFREVAAEAQGPGKGMIRLFRGEGRVDSAKGPIWKDPDMNAVAGRWFTPDEAMAQRFADEASARRLGPGRVVYVDVPRDVYEGVRVSNRADYARLGFGQHEEPGLAILSPEWAAKAKPLVAEAPPVTAATTPRVTAAPGALVDPILKESIHRGKVLPAAEELFTRAGVQRDPERLISDQILDLMNEGRLQLPEIEATLKANGLSFLEFGQQLFRPAVKDAARRLQALSALSQRINRIAKTPEAKEELTQLLDLAGEIDEGVRLTSWWRRADNIRRGLLVSQLATAARNFETQVGRVGLDVLDQGMQAGLQRILGKTPTIHPLDGAEAFLNFFRRTKRGQADTILQAFPREYDRLFGSYHADIANRARESGVVLKGADALLTQAEQGVALLNTANRFQEFLVRRSVFMAKLSQGMRAKGLSLEQAIAEQRLGAIPEDAVKAAVQSSLEMTFAKSPEYGTVARAFVDAVNKLPGATFAIPFPRFMVNSLKFLYDFSPTGYLKLVSPAQRAEIAGGNMQAISRATIGTAMLGAAYEFRASEYAGEKWYEAKLPNGQTLDLRPFNPFASYLFVADVARRYNTGTLYRLEAKDLATGILSANVRAGTGLFIVDGLLRGLTEIGDPEKGLRALKGFAGEVAAGFLTPLQQVSDVLAQFDESQRTGRATRTEPFTGPVKAKIPGLRETLPPIYLPTRAEPLVREETLLRQMTGALITTAKNPLEKELDRMQFNRQEIMPSTGEPEADNLIAKHMGRLAESRIVPKIDSPTYRQASDAKRGELLRLWMTGIGVAAKSQAAAENPDLFKRLAVQSVPRRERLFLRERAGAAGNERALELFR